MNSNSRVLTHLSREECLQLMASIPVGRVIFTRRAMPAVELVGFVVTDGDIVAGVDAEVVAATRDAVVAFEADELDVGREAGWSVTVIGRAREVTEPGEIQRLRSLPLPCLTGKDRLIRISSGLVNGRRLIDVASRAA